MAETEYRVRGKGYLRGASDLEFLGMNSKLMSLVGIAIVIGAMVDAAIAAPMVGG